MNVELDGESLTINKLVNVARNDSLVKITDKSWTKIENCLLKGDLAFILLLYIVVKEINVPYSRH